MCKSDVAWQLENCSDAAADAAAAIVGPLALLLPAVQDPVITFDETTVAGGATITATITWPVADTYHYDILMTQNNPLGVTTSPFAAVDTITLDFLGAEPFSYTANQHVYAISNNTGISVVALMNTLAGQFYFNIVWNGRAITSQSQLLTWT